MKKIELKGRRKTTKPFNLRARKMVPGVLYGPTIENQMVKLPMADVKRLDRELGNVYEIPYKGKTIMARLEQVQKNPRTGNPVHFSFVQMPKGMKNEVEVPIIVNGPSVGEKKGGVVVVLKDALKVFGKPRAIPTKIKADISDLDIGDKITVDELDLPREIRSMDRYTEVVAVCRPPAKVETDDDSPTQPELGLESALHQQIV
jgi:large subunit ribosomal protein L25